MVPKTPLPRTTRRFLAIFGSPPGAPNRPKIDPWPQKGRQEALFYRFFPRKAFFSFLGSIFHDFLVKNRWKIGCMFSKLRAIFSTWQPLKSMHRRSVLSTSQIFYFFWNLWKILKKLTKSGDQKNHRKMKPRESQNRPKMAQNSSTNQQTLNKKAKKAWKLRGRFFDDFLGGQKTCPGGSAHPRESLKWSLGSSGG